MTSKSIGAFVAVVIVAGLIYFARLMQLMETHMAHMTAQVTSMSQNVSEMNVSMRGMARDMSSMDASFKELLSSMRRMDQAIHKGSEEFQRWNPMEMMQQIPPQQR